MSVPEIIAEVKTVSPFGFTAIYSWEDSFKQARKIGDIISIHTDARWGGSFELLQQARSMTSKSILAKGIHQDDSMVQKAIENGADWVLVVGRIPKVHPERCMIEPLTLSELKIIPRTFRVVWNTRDLKDGKQKTETFEEARRVFKGWLCQASNIHNVRDIKEGADAVLVGEHLHEFAKSLKSIRNAG